MSLVLWRLTLLALLFGIMAIPEQAQVRAQTPQPAQNADAAVPASMAQMQLSFAPLVKQVSPAVVNVYVTRRVKQFNSPFDDAFLQEFFGRRYGGPRERLENSLGSGVLVSPDGLVVTNNHVVKGSGDDAEIRIALSDKREFDAKLILRDEEADLAVLRIVSPENNFPFLIFDDSDTIDVGDLVLAIGNPFGVGQTVTSGIISALARTTVGSSDSQYFIQTDAAINPGNSGGALVNLRGRLVGINTMIFSRSGGSIGIGFAIPSNLVKPFVDSAISGRQIRRPWFGAKLEPVTRDIASALGLTKVEGAFVSEVYPDSPAARAGVQVKDIVIGLDDRDIEDPRALTYRLNTKEVGGTARVKLYRDSAPIELDLELAEAPSLKSAAQTQLGGAHPLSGTRVVELTPTLAAEIGFPPEMVGIVLAEVPNASVAQSFGIQPGDVLLRVNGQRIQDLQTVERAFSRPRRLWNLDFRRGRSIFSLSIPG
jgi:Do/DeqQ family serine protease